MQSVSLCSVPGRKPYRVTERRGKRSEVFQNEKGGCGITIIVVATEPTKGTLSGPQNILKSVSRTQRGLALSYVTITANNKFMSSKVKFTRTLGL